MSEQDYDKYFYSRDMHEGNLALSDKEALDSLLDESTIDKDIESLTESDEEFCDYCGEPLEDGLCSDNCEQSLEESGLLEDKEDFELVENLVNENNEPYEYLDEEE